MSCKLLMKCSRCKSKAQPLPFGPPESSEILGSPEKGWASFPEWQQVVLSQNKSASHSIGRKFSPPDSRGPSGAEDISDGKGSAESSFLIFRGP